MIAGFISIANDRADILSDDFTHNGNAQI